jgi:hypothetical protein
MYYVGVLWQWDRGVSEDQRTEFTYRSDNPTMLMTSAYRCGD